MAKDSSFDVVSDYDTAEMTNALDQTQRELMSRYDFKGTTASIEYGDGKTSVLVTGDTQNQLNSILDVFQSKLIKREVPLQVLDTTAEPVQGGKEMRWTINFVKGLDQDKAKKVTKLIRDGFPKVKTQVQGDSVRVTAASRDDLQGAIAALRAADFEFPLQFENYR